MYLKQNHMKRLTSEMSKDIWGKCRHAKSHGNIHVVECSLGGKDHQG